MQAVVFHGIGDIRLDKVADPKIKEPTDAIVRITTSAICGTDLHMVRGTMTGMKPGTILGHEGLGIIEEVGRDVRNLRVGDRVLIPSTIACGACSYCRAGYQAQCDRANPNGAQAGTAFFGGPAMSGPFDGLQAERARVPFAHATLVKLPERMTDDQAILLSDIFPTGWFGAKLAEISPGDTVVVFGCGPVGQFAIASAKILGAGRIFAVDSIPSRLEVAQRQGAEIINFEKEHPVETILRLTNNVGVDRAIDAVGVDANHAHHGPASKLTSSEKKEFEQQVKEVAPDGNKKGEAFHPGDGPSQVLDWSVKALAKAGTLSIIGVYPDTARRFPIGAAMMRNLTVRMGNCHHRHYIPKLIDLVVSGVVDPLQIFPRKETLGSVIEAYKHFDLREEGWMKVELDPLTTKRAT